ncbi:Transmembrane protein 41A [Entomortierella beljakovae]|nr:Transmembrane protein 41A [Entomortierella beljakovae]
MSTTSTATASALARFHVSSAGTPARQRSSSVTNRGTKPSFSINSPLDSQPHTLSTRWTATTTTSNNNQSFTKPINQREKVIALSDLSTLLTESKNPSNRVHNSVSLDRINLVPQSIDQTHLNNINNNNNNTSHKGNDHQLWLKPGFPQDQNSDISTQGNSPSVWAGRNRSNTISTIIPSQIIDTPNVSFSTQFEHTVRPRRPSIVSHPIPTHTPSTLSAPPSHTLYHPESTLPQFNTTDDPKDSTSLSNSYSASSLGNFQLGFLPRIFILIGIFIASLGGLYFLAQVLPPLSLPKSIDDVKVDAGILQEFATATYEGWIRTFWVFSIVYMWKQCFGIPGSAFLNILAGALYGPWFGTILTSLLTTLGSVLAYFMSFFLMEPILNRYASGRLDQMRRQIQKKTMGKNKRRNSSENQQDNSIQMQQLQQPQQQPQQPSIISTSSLTPNITSPGMTAPNNIRNQLRPRASSFTVRKADISEQNSLSQKNHEANFQENDRLIIEEREGESSAQSTSRSNNVTANEQDADMDTEDDDDSEGTSLFMQLLLIRLFPLTPYWFINLASPLVGVPVIPFMTSMFLGVTPYNYICAQAGAILSEIHELRDIYHQPLILFQIVIVLVLSSAAVFVSKRSKKKQAEGSERKSRNSDETAGDEATHQLLRTFDEGESFNNSSFGKFEGQDSVPMSNLDSQNYNGSSNRDSAIIDMSGYRY